MHKVTPKETFYSIARHYNVHPRYLIRYNTHIDGLQIGDTVRMEIDSMNTFQNLVLVPENDQPDQETTFPTTAATPQSTVTEHVVAQIEIFFAIPHKYGLTTRKRVVKGKRASVRGDLGGNRTMKKKKKQ